jgi:hypothetical protein
MLKFFTLSAKVDLVTPLDSSDTFIVNQTLSLANLCVYTEITTHEFHDSVYCVKDIIRLFVFVQYFLRTDMSGIV